jgi:hypothetical protein
MPSPRPARPEPTRARAADDVTLYRRTYVVERRLRFVAATEDWLRDVDMDQRAIAPIVHDLQGRGRQLRQKLDDLTHELLGEGRGSEAWELHRVLDGKARPCSTVASA